MANEYYDIWEDADEIVCEKCSGTDFTGIIGSCGVVLTCIFCGHENEFAF
jgi:hypothetical protein